MSDLDREIEQFFTEARREVKEYFEDLGQRAVAANIAEGDYKNRTGNLRRSNYYKATEEGLELGNSASYASEVESRGYNVIDSGVKLIMEEIG
jgi:hypothetical protein